MWANVNGWLIPVAGTKTGAPPGLANDTDYSNIITLDPPPSGSGDSRIDFVFLEVWKARIQPNPSDTNKPSAGHVYKYGNVDTGFNYLPDDLVDPAIGFETNQRVQIQYRIRVVKGLVGLTSNPDGFDPIAVKAQGAAAAPTSEPFVNMRRELGDPGLWRAGDGTQNALATVDGYSYAVPIAVVFRRNSFAWTPTPSQNLNGGFNRNPTADDRTGIKTFSTIPTLATSMTATASSLQLVSVTNLPLPAAPATPVLIQVGDELMTYSVIADNSLIVTRGVANTLAEPHAAGSVVSVVSGRPDGLFSDQIASTDILDLRHLVSPNGFNYDALLKSNLDKLLRGQLRANWKQSGTSPRGPYVHYQDAITSTSTSLGVTKLDATDNIRMVFSDAATVQPVDLLCRPATSSIEAPATGTLSETWSLLLTVTSTRQLAGGKFSVGDKLILPVAQLKGGLQAGGGDQVRWLNDGLNSTTTGVVRLRFEGDTSDLPVNMYTVTPPVPGPEDDLVITFIDPFPGMVERSLLRIRAYVVYGPGRGISRRPDALHSIVYNGRKASVAWAPLWSRYRGDASNGQLPSTSEMYADLGSKTVIVSPFRRIDFTPELVTIDGRSANRSTSPRSGAPTFGTLSTANDKTISISGSLANVSAGNALVIASGPGQGRYTVHTVGANSITVDRPIRAKSGSLSFTIHTAQGLMPSLSVSGAAKWTQGTDPLGLFCGSNTGNPRTESIYVSLPRHLVPGWGELAAPVVATATDAVPTGINFMVRTAVGATPPAAHSNYAAYAGSATKEFSVFSQVTPVLAPSLTPLPYNTATTTGVRWAGIQFFADNRGMGRQGLQFPPFYGIARLFGVYEARDYLANSSPFTLLREAGGTGTAVNLLRQSMGPKDGPSMWIEIDSDGDSTFILNANAIDITRSPNSISSFDAGTYVVEAVVFGFDRGSFDINNEFRLVMTRPGNPNGWAAPDTTDDRAANINKVVAGLAAFLPGPAPQSDQIVLNYSRTVYQGDPWGSQTGAADLGYAPGPLLSETAYQLRTRLNQNALAQQNQKVLEVLASTSFSTDLGTGRYSAEASDYALDFRNVAYEEPSVFPPTTIDALRPKSLPGNFVSGDVTNISPEYLGCTERLPLGALFRDKDFRGQAFTNLPSPLVYSDSVGAGPATGFYGGSQEQQEISLGPATSGIGSPGDLLVHVDGEQNPPNYTTLTKYRVTRGGSLFTASGPRPGGSLSLQTLPTATQTTHVNVLHGRAMLVRNSVTNVGGNEVSAGDELMMLIVTTAQRAASGSSVITIGTSGAGEGYSAADLYRIEGHPLVRNNTHVQIDASTIVLSRG
jgi:hypothetical protein